MARTATPGEVVLDHGTFQADAVPDMFDARDLEYRPRVQALPRELECRPEDHFVMSQEGSSCTGHAMAAMINAVLAGQKDPVHVSPYMLYALARRYDEFEGEADAGSSLRGALKGWYYHGVLPDSDWPSLDLSPEPDLDLDQTVLAAAAQRPLGAFYRVNASRLDDLQSAVAELSAVVVSAAIHDGWNEPALVTRTVRGEQQEMHVIDRTGSSDARGGHAFCIVGYNEVGFLVQNSWGTDWGRQGFATLPYDDWLETGYDAWVARPGVPSVVSERARRKIFALAGGGLVDAPGPDLQQLAGHVVNLGNNGRLSKTGRFTSSAAQLDRIFEQMDAHHDAWGSSPRRIVLYAHGGLNSERSGLDVAQRQVNWWLRNEVYPVTFAWQTGLSETIENQLSDLIGPRQPAGGWSFNLFEQVDRMVEKAVRSRLRWVWDEMKENAARASEPLPDGYRDRPESDLPGASLTVARLREHLDRHPDVPTEVHLVGHSAGAIFLISLLDRLADDGVEVSSLTYLAAAVRVDAWMAHVLPHLESGHAARFTAFGMSPALELDDTLATGRVTAYHKSLLYLVSRGFEEPTTDAESRAESEVPLVGMAHFARTTVGGRTYADAVAANGGDLVWSPNGTTPDSRSESTTHGGFDDDSPTMTSLLLRILGQDTVQPGNEYAPHLPPISMADSALTRPSAVDDQLPEVVLAAGPSRVMSALEQHGWTIAPAG